MCKMSKQSPVASPGGPGRYTLTWGESFDWDQSYADLQKVANRYQVAIKVEAGIDGPAHTLSPKRKGADR